MNALSTLPPASRGRLVADLYMASVRDHRFVCLEGPDGGRETVLDRFASELAGSRTCMLRIRGAGLAELGLTELTEQLAAHAPAPDDALDDDGRVLAFSVLTDAAGQHDRVMLILDGAHRLTPAAARYIDLACQHCGRLRVVLAGLPGMLATPGQLGMEGLARRVTRTLTMPSGNIPVQLCSNEATLIPRQQAESVKGASDGAGGVSRPWRLASFDARVVAGMAAAVAVISWVIYPGGQTESVPVVQQAVEVAAADLPSPARVGHVAEAAPPVASTEVIAEPVASAPETVAAVPTGPAIPLSVQPETDDAALALPVPPVPPEPAKIRTTPKPTRPNLPDTERVALVRTAQPESELCRRILVKAQLGEEASDAERRFMRGGCRS